jgi:cell division septal protein FtsQ
MARDKNAGRRRCGAVIYTPIAVLLIVIIAIFGISAFFRITDIEVSGAKKYNDEQIRTASAPPGRRQPHFCRQEGGGGKIGLNLPYLSDITVRRSFP